MSRFNRSVNQVLLTAALSIAWLNAARAQPAWVPTNIGTLGQEAVARAVNNHGVVVGDSVLLGSRARHMFLWTAAGGMVDVGTMGGFNAYGRDINDAGQVAGAGDMVVGDPLHAFFWSATTGFIDICEGEANAINNQGVVVGRCVGRGLMMWSAAEGIVDLGTIPGAVNGSYSVTDVNDAGTVVGVVFTSAHIEDMTYRAFVWTRSGGMTFVDPNGRYVGSVHINNRGDILIGGRGYVLFNSLWLQDGSPPLPVSILARNINDRGQVVGAGATAQLEPASIASVWSVDRDAIELGSVFGVMGVGSSINNAGLIAGSADEATGTGTITRAIVWRPREDLAIDFGPAYGTWIRAGTTYTPLHGRSPVNIITGDLDGTGTDDLLINFGDGTGVWAWMNKTSWLPITNLSPSRMIAADLDGDRRDEIVCVFPGAGLWSWRQGTWTLLHPVDATILAAAQLDGQQGKDLIVSLPGYGVYAWQNDSAWILIHPFEASTIVGGDLDGSGHDDLVIDFPGAGIGVLFNNSVWRWLELPDAARIAAGDIDGDGYTDLVVDFGPGQGVWIYRNGTTWAHLHSLSVENLTLADLDGTGKDEIVLDFGPTYGLWQYANDSMWEFLHGLSPGAIAAAALH